MRTKNSAYIVALIILFNLLNGQFLRADTSAASTNTASKPLRPGDYIPSLFEQRYSQPFVVQRLTRSTYIAMVSAHNATFYVGKKGVMVIDTTDKQTAPGLIAAIRSVTSLPITTLVYSHYHMDHVGGAQLIVDEAKKSSAQINIVSNQAVADQIKRYGNRIPVPTQIIDNRGGEFEFEGTSVEILLPELGGGHSPDNSIIYLPEEKVLHYVDIIHPELLFPYFSLGVYDVLAMKKSLQQTLNMEWDYVNGGHGNIGSKQDVKALLEYMDDLKSAVTAALQSVPFTDHVNPEAGVYAWIKSHEEAMTAKVKQSLANKYGHIPNFDAVIGSHVKAMKTHLTLY